MIDSYFPTAGDFDKWVIKTFGTKDLKKIDRLDLKRKLKDYGNKKPHVKVLSVKARIIEMLKNADKKYTTKEIALEIKAAYSYVKTVLLELEKEDILKSVGKYHKEHTLNNLHVQKPKKGNYTKNSSSILVTKALLKSKTFLTAKEIMQQTGLNYSRVLNAVIRLRSLDIVKSIGKYSKEYCLVDFNCREVQLVKMWEGEV